MGGCSSLPYDAEVEYLSSNNAAAFTMPADFDKIQFRIKFNNSAANDLKIFGNSCAYEHWKMLACYKSTYRGTRIPTSNNVWDTVTMESGSLTVEREGGSTYTASSWWMQYNGATDTQYGTIMPFFYIIASNGTWVNGNKIGSSPSYAIFVNSVKTWKSGTLQCDYIPVRKGSVGYMYDNVSGQLFGNINADQSDRYFGFGADV